MEAACPRPTEPAPLECEARSGPSCCENSSCGRCQGKSVQSYDAGFKAPKGGKMQFWEEGQGLGNLVKRRIP